MVLYPKASCSIRWVSAADFFLKIETQFDADFCSLKSFISVVKKSPNH